jgi:hypothetical protein
MYTCVRFMPVALMLWRDWYLLTATAIDCTSTEVAGVVSLLAFCLSAAAFTAVHIQSQTLQLVAGGGWSQPEWPQHSHCARCMSQPRGCCNNCVIFGNVCLPAAFGAASSRF